MIFVVKAERPGPEGVPYSVELCSRPFGGAGDV